MIDVDAFAAEAAGWLAANKHHAPRDYGAITPPDLIDRAIDWQQRLFANGWAGIHWPVEHGGRGLTPAHNSAWILECARAGVPPFLNMVGMVLAGGAILRFGTPAQQADHLRRTIAAEHVWCQLFSEPGAGSDLASLTTRAERDGDTYVVNGQKVWTSGGRYSNWGILMARTNPDAPKHKGISFFLFDMDLPGVEVRPLRQMTGEAEFDEVFFTDVRMPASALLGPEDEGWGVGMAVLTNERGHIGASIIGLERRLEQLAQIGAGGLGPAQRDALARMMATGMSYKYMAQRQGPVASTAASLMKLGITELMFAASELRADVAGSATLEWDAALGSGLLAAPGGRIAGGSSQVQRNIIGERLLGLPKEPGA